jgi:hypothetical protein
MLEIGLLQIGAPKPVAGNPDVIWLEPVLAATAVLAADQTRKALVLRWRGREHDPQAATAL